MGRLGWREGVAAMNPLNGSSGCLVFPECTWSEGWEITHPQWSKTLRDHNEITRIKNICAMSTMWNIQVSRRSNRATRSSSLANDSDCLLVGWAGSESFQQLKTNNRPLLPLVVTCPPTGWTASELSRQKWKKLAQSTASSLPTTLVKRELPTGWSFLCDEILICALSGSEPTWWLTVEKLLEKKHGLSFKLVQLSSKWEALAKGKKVLSPQNTLRIHWVFFRCQMITIEQETGEVSSQFDQSQISHQQIKFSWKIDEVQRSSPCFKNTLIETVICVRRTTLMIV